MSLHYSENYYIRVLLNTIKIEEVMVKNVITIDVNEPFSHAWEKLRQHHIRHLPVTEGRQALVGIITQRDIYRIHSPRKLEDGSWYYDKQSLDNNILRHVMTKDLFTLSPEDKIAEALFGMVDRKYGCIPIVEKGNILCGLLTQIDILKLGVKILREK